jgi:POT family proton-dependent oligopeptide transporter
LAVAPIPPTHGDMPPAVHPAVGTNPDIESASDGAVVVDNEKYPIPTDEDHSTLRKVAGSIPAVSYVLCFAELCERASYYGVQTVFNNFMEFPLPDDGPGTGAINPANPNDTAGALNGGLQFASALGLLFQFMSYVFPLLGAYIADTKLGRFRTIMLGILIGGVAHIIMICGAVPSLLTAGRGTGPFMVSFFLLAIGAGSKQFSELLSILAYARSKICLTWSESSPEQLP